MITLKRLKIKGFRAYMEDKEFIFDNLVILLFGDNGTGKSSALNAIEWCLFGNDCIGAKSGIRERIDWEIPNRNLGPRSDIYVELELEDENKNAFKILRRWISKTKDELKVTLTNGQSLEEQYAKEKLAQLLKSSFRDFLTTVYQHQEVIRAILTQEPKERNDAIDRLLGLSDYRNILTGIEATKLTAKQKKMGSDFDSFTREIDAVLRARENDLKDKRRTAVQKGLKEEQLCEKGALEIAGGVKSQLVNFGLEAGLSVVDLQVPEQWTDLYGFKDIADGEIKRFRSEMPDAKKQQELFKRRAEITELKEKYTEQEKGWKSVKSDYDIKEKETIKMKVEVGKLEKKISELEKERSEVSARGVVIREAINYLELEGIDTNVCPVCGTKKLDLLGHLQKEWVERYEKIIGKIQDELERCEKRRCEVKAWFEEYNRIKRSFESAYKRVAEVRKEIGEALNREITAEDDPNAILNNALEGVNKGLEVLEEAVKSKQERLDGIASLMEKMQLIADILSSEEKKRVVEQIQESSEYLRMEELKDEIAILVDDVEKIKEAISEASHEAAEQKVTAASGAIDNYFRRIANHPTVTKIEFSVSVDLRTARNFYEFKDQNGKYLTPILNQGDLNALALSIFLGMSSLKGATQPFGFVMLDDPSQSAGSGYKEKLVEVLDEVLDERMVILSSMDKELQDFVLSKITKAKTKYIFSDRIPERGPEIIKE